MERFQKSAFKRGVVGNQELHCTAAATRVKINETETLGEDSFDSNTVIQPSRSMRD